MKRLVYIIIGIAFLSGATSCSSKNDQKVKYASPWMSFILSDSDLKVAKDKALKKVTRNQCLKFKQYSDGKIDTI
jgi:hypothetical protein